VTKTLLVLLLASPVLAADVLVATPAEFDAAVRTARPGDAIVLKDGTWTDAALALKASGDADHPITLRAQTPGRVIVTGRSRLEVAGNHLVVDGLHFDRVSLDFRNLLLVTRDSTHCRITNCAFTDCNPSPDAKKISTLYVELQGADHRVDHCYFSGKRTIGQTLVVTVSDRPNRDRIDHNHFGPRPPLGENGGETIRVGLSQVSMNSSRAVVEDNLFDRCDGEIEVVSNKSSDNVYRRNTFLDCAGTLTLRHGNRCTVHSNFVLPHGKKNAGGIRVIGEDHVVTNNYLEAVPGDGFASAISLVDGIPHSKPEEYFQVKHVTVAFNTVVDCKRPITLGAGHGDRNRIEPPLDCTIANNLFAGPHAPLVTFADQPLNARWLSNVFHGADPGLPDAAVADPKLARTDGLLQPSPGSPLIAKAQGDFPKITHDILGRSRPASAKAIGCFEPSDAAVTNRPLTPADVGPGWMKDRP
jgi:poly(beta-D-mannuronate) lyase